jgi:hypothetical protein
MNCLDVWGGMELAVRCEIERRSSSLERLKVVVIAAAQFDLGWPRMRRTHRLRAVARDGL